MQETQPKFARAKARSSAAQRPKPRSISLVTEQDARCRGHQWLPLWNHRKQVDHALVSRSHLLSMCASRDQQATIFSDFTQPRAQGHNTTTVTGCIQCTKLTQKIKTNTILRKSDNIHTTISVQPLHCTFHYSKHLTLHYKSTLQTETNECKNT